jgi:magnesium-transporting ATPase (P-type)
MIKRLDIHMAEIELTRSDKLSPGDIIEVAQGEICPADIVLIKGKNISVMQDGAYETKNALKFTRGRLPNYNKIIHF